MAPATKAEAKAKLAALKVGVGYPDRWRDYSGARDRARTTRSATSQRAELFDYRTSSPSSASRWTAASGAMTPQTVNAVNLPVQNALNFPAAILEPPFFDPRAPAAVNYGAIGAVIGHEISHSFDDQGASSTPTGRLRELVDAGGPRALRGVRRRARRASTTPIGPSPTCTSTAS